MTELKKEIKNANPPKLYDLTTLQRDANKQFGYTAKQTLDFLQSLYEKKLSTYPRTDSQYLSDDMEQTAASMIHTVFSIFSNFGSPQEINVKRCINNAKVSGHHAILPTEKIAKTDLSTLSEGELHILKLISARLVMATAMPHKYEAAKITVNCEHTDFFASGKTVLQDGWKAIDKTVKAALKNANADTEQKEEQPLPEVIQGQIFEDVSAQKAEHFTTPPKPYTEDTLLSAIEHAGLENYDEDAEKKGLGTPATRAAIIEGLVAHGFAQRKGKQITAAEKGVNLIACCPEEVKSPKLTADWEMQLQQVERGEYAADAFMNGIITFVQDICKRYGTIAENSQFAVQSEPIGNCPKSGKPVKKGKFGFYCTGKCGMNLAKVYGKELTETQLKKLLDGKEISYTANGKKTIVLPEAVQNDYNGKTYFQWRTKKG